MSRAFQLQALAKINLDLRVLFRRPDHYHEIRTVFQTISLADRIEVRYEPAESVSIVIDGNEVIADNLIERAARLVMRELECGGTLHFELAKEIPMGAGLGGGSSDAAAVLLALPALIGKEIRTQRLSELAAQLGSDVAFFLHGGTALGLGRGEELYPLPDFPALPGLLVAPAIQVSTPDAYRALASWPSTGLAAADPVDEIERKRAAFARFAWTEDLTLASNDFEEPVFAQHPPLRQLRETLDHSGAICARMTGSGSALFALYHDPADAIRTQRELAAERTFRFSMVNRESYRALWRKQTTFRSEPERTA